MRQEADQTYSWKGRVYVPFHAVRLAAGPFLSMAPDWVDQHVELPPGVHFGVQDRYVSGVRMQRGGLAAARVHGDSMIYKDIVDGDIAIFQRWEFADPKSGTVVVIEKVSDEEGFGPWALKKLVFERARSSHRNEYNDEIDWDDPVLALHSYNPRVSLSRLDPSGQYRVHGIFLRVLRRHEVNSVDSEWIHDQATGK